MSAFIVTRAHIDLLVSAALRYRVGVIHGPDGKEVFTCNDNTADELGRLLWTENHRSVNYRYREKTKAPDYYFRERAAFSPVEAIKAVHCFEYQSCEHDGWEDSTAKRICERIIRAATHALPGYDDAPWGVYDENGHAAGH